MREINPGVYGITRIFLVESGKDLLYFRCKKWSLWKSKVTKKRLRRREKGRKYQTFCKNDMNKKRRLIWIEAASCHGV